MNKPDPDECADFYQQYIDDQQAHNRYAPEKWSMKEILGHLIDTERLFVYRALCFARNDPGPLPGMNENDWVKHADFDACKLHDLLKEYEHVRLASLSFFSNIADQVATRRGIASDCEFTVRSLPYIIAGHERHHLDVLKERYLDS